jgi:hypothetical protein
VSDNPSVWTQVHRLAAAVLLPLALTVCRAAGQSSGADLTVDRSPAEGGAVTPETGVHTFTLQSDVTITATAQDGYKFAYWLGDVEDPTSSTTRVRMGGSKSVIAVFEQEQVDAATEQQEDLIVGSAAGSGGGGGGGMITTTADLWAGGGISSMGGSPATTQTIVVKVQPPAVPEPATLTLLGLGTAILTRARARSKSGPR